MGKSIVIGTIAVFVAWTAMDVVIHGILLMPVYEATAALWRPMSEMKQAVLHVTTLVSALFFVAIYASGFAGRGSRAALLYGLCFGLAVGVSMGFGTYAVQPIPLILAVSWLLGTLAEAIVGALVALWVFNRFGGVPSR